MVNSSKHAIEIFKIIKTIECQVIVLWNYKCLINVSDKFNENLAFYVHCYRDVIFRGSSKNVKVFSFLLVITDKEEIKVVLECERNEVKLKQKCE